MRRQAGVPGLTALALLAALAGPTHAAKAKKAAPVFVADTVAASKEIVRDTVAVASDALHLSRAVAEQARGDLPAAVEQLEAIDYATEPTFAEADRAAFLLGRAYLRLGAAERFAALAHHVAGWRRATPYTRWLAWQLAVQGGDVATLPVAKGSLLGTWLEALATEAAGGDASRAWTALIGADSVSALGRDLDGAARVRLATAALERGEDPRAMLEPVAPGSRYASRARHLCGLIALERGEHERGVAILSALLAEDSNYVARREVEHALAGRALDEGRFQASLDGYGIADADWIAHRAALEHALAEADFAALWASWRAGEPLSDAIAIDGAAAAASVDELAAASQDLVTRPATEPPDPTPAPTPAPLRWSVAPPAADELAAVDAAARAAEEAGYAVGRAEREAAHERERLAELRRYLGGGVERTLSERSSLDGRAAHLDSLRGMLDALDARLRAAGDTASLRVERRTRDLLAACEAHLVWLAAMRRFHLDGPERARPPLLPPGAPSPTDLVVNEENLVRAIHDYAARVAEEAPGLISRSYLQAWRPGVIDRAAGLGIEAHALLAWARSLEVSIDSSRTAAATSPTLLALEARTAELGRAADSARAAHHALEDAVARTAVERAMAVLDEEREGIDYGLAAASYGLVALAPADSGADPEAEDAAAAARRDQAVAHLRNFLAAHPSSPARGEMRFRLADMLIVDARADFREAMARFVQDQADGRGGAVPLLSVDPALELYRAILAEDPTFARRDAVLYNAGMILADRGDPEAATYFQDLVEHHPDSPWVQESWLRMGDLAFQQARFTDCVALYEHAAAGPDVSMRAIALYKTGWAHSNAERFMPAADAFRAVLDLYEEHRDTTLQVDVEREAETHLVNALGRAGGAKAWASYFDGIGGRPYAVRVLMGLGHHFRRYSMFAEAAEVDRLVLDRRPLDVEALSAAQRLADTYGRWGRTEEADRARLDLAPRFAPGSPWAAAQTSDSVRAEGAAFAKGSYLMVAGAHHERARAKDSVEEWRTALDLYETVLAKWPDDSDAAELHAHSGEARVRLGDHPGALAHYAATARTGVDSLAAHALWQRVAVTDDWYESTRPAAATGRTGVGRDTLARAVLAAGDELLARFPDHPKGANLTWRQGQLAFAHGWNERAAADLGRMAARWPKDPRAPRAAGLQADALFREGKFDAAGVAYESTLVMARRAGLDSLARRAEAAVPVCAFRNAESAVAADSTAYARHAELFERVATRWPRFEHAHVALYRAGLAHLAAGDRADAVKSFEGLIREFPKSEYVRDAHLQVAAAWKAAGKRELAAEAWLAFAARYPKDATADDAWLEAADLLAAAGKNARAEELRLEYIRKWPDDLESAMEILEPLARRDLASVTAERPISTLLPPPAAAAKGKKAAAKKAVTKAATKTAVVTPPAPPTHLAEYLRRAEARPDLASKSLLAQRRFLEGEESFAAYSKVRLTQPLEKSIDARKKRLDALLAAYRKAVEIGVPEWSHAASFRIGEALVAFGEALEKSERPADLKGDDLLAYEDVVLRQSNGFHDRGEGVWIELLRATKDAPEDPWLEKAKSTLWGRLANRFYFRPEPEYPVVAARPPDRKQTNKNDSSPAPARAADSGASRSPAAAGGLRAPNEVTPR